MKKIIALLLFILVLSGCAAQAEKTGYRQVTTDEAISIM